MLVDLHVLVVRGSVQELLVQQDDLSILEPYQAVAIHIDGDLDNCEFWVLHYLYFLD